MEDLNYSRKPQTTKRYVDEYERGFSPVNDSEEKEDISNIVEAARIRAKKRENDRQRPPPDDTNQMNSSSILPDDNRERVVSTRHRSRDVRAPWHTDPNEGIGNGINPKYQLPKRTNNTNSVKSTSQMDFPTYSNNEIRESRQASHKQRNTESVPWYPEYTANKTKEVAADDYVTYKSSSAAIGESFMNVFGVDSASSPSTNGRLERRPKSPPVAASALRNTPYASHN